MLKEDSHLSLHYQLEQTFLDKLHNGEWPVGYRIPTELQLSDQYQVSRSTVRQALGDLELKGLLYRKQGKGTFVTAPKIEQRLAHFYSFSKEIESLGYTPETKLLAFETAEDVSTLWPDARKGAYYRIRRLRLADGEPFALETSYVPCGLFPRLQAEQVSKKGLYAALRGISAFSPDSAEESFEAVLLSKADSLLLHTQTHAPALRLNRTTFAQDEIVEYCLSFIRGDRYKYRILLK